MFRHLFLLLSLACAMNAGAQKPVNENTKFSPTLRQALERKGAKDSIDLVLSLSSATGISSIQRIARIIYIHPSSHTVVARMSRGDLERVAEGPEILFAGAYIQPKEELYSGINDLTLNKVNYVHDRFPFLDGSTLSVTIKERAFDSTDIDLKGRVFKTLLENTVNTSHASLMATIVAGAANSSYFARGVASGVLTGSTSFANLLPETDSFFRKHGISVQNHSYGTIVENFYGSEAAAYDQSSVNNPTLLHVFSSGNSGTANGTGPYAGITGYANLTGNAKHAKNILVAGATDSITQIEALSSKGPAHDGRIKPELVAFGQEGSSGAAAMVSGGALLVQHAYSRMQGSVPSSSLVKAALINGADEAGAPNPDHLSGYGSLNAYRAVEAIMQSRFHQNSVAQDEVRSFSLNIPSGISRLKLTLVWTDPAAAPNAARALVNDLDLVLRNTSSGQTWLPWGLSHAAHKDSLLLPARRQRDSVNNVEQVSIDAPAAGNYIIEVKGTKLATASQAFSLVYQLDTADRFTWTYPMSTDPLIAGTTQILRWETSRTGTGVLEYSYDDGNWKSITNINLSTNYYKWAVPDTLALARLRMRTGSTEALSDTFVISPQLDLNLGFECVDSFMLYWDRLPEDSYELLQLGSRYMEPFLQTSDTAVVLSVQQHPPLYYSVRPIIGNRKGLRSNSLNRAQGSGCYVTSFYLQLQTPEAAHFKSELGTLYLVSEVNLQKFINGNYTTIRTSKDPSSTVQLFTDSTLTQGENIYRLQVVLTNGTILYGNRIVLYHFPQGSPVIIYPNPAMQNGPLRILSNESGRYTATFFDAQGRLLWTQELNSTVNEIPSMRLSRGMYYIRFADRDGKPFTSKLVVY